MLESGGLTINEFTLSVGFRDIHSADEVEPRANDPLWCHTDLSRRLGVFPRRNWLAFAYDQTQGLFFIYRVDRDTLYGVIYPRLDPTTAAIMLQYVSCVASLKAKDSKAWFESGRQIAVVRLNNANSYFVHTNTSIIFPRPSSSSSHED